MEYTHYVLDNQGRIVGFAGSVEQVDQDISLAFVSLFGMERFAEYGYVASRGLLPLKKPVTPAEAVQLAGAVV